MGRGLLQILVHLQKDIIFFLKKYWISSKDLLVFRGNSKTRKHFCKICWQIVCCRPDIENNFSIFSDSINGKGDEEPLIWPPASNRPIQQFSVVFLKVFNEKNPLFQPNYLYFFSKNQMYHLAESNCQVHFKKKSRLIDISFVILSTYL